MRKLLLCLITLAIIACKKDVPKDYVTLSGKIINKNSDSLFIYQGRAFSKTIKVNEDGSFSDTLKVATGMYGIYDGNEAIGIFLKNGYDLELSLDAKEFSESIKYTGNGEVSNNYIVKKALMQKTILDPAIFDLEAADFNAKIVELETSMNDFLENNKDGLDSLLVANEQKELAQFKTGITRAYKQQQSRAAQFSDFTGKPSPVFENYENANGGTTSLSDLKGKYVYIDVWATWCGPCIREIPALKEVEKDFHDKNIEFVSLSVDDGRGFKGDAAAAREGWKKMIKEKNLGGIQILSDKGWQSDFVQGFKIQGIPRFILIDPAGNVVNADAPRPSSPKLREVLNNLDNI